MYSLKKDLYLVLVEFSSNFESCSKNPNVYFFLTECFIVKEELLIITRKLNQNQTIKNNI